MSENREETASLLSTASILIVDDEPGMRHFLVKTLRPLCRAVDEAPDTEAAERLLAARQYDVMVLDNLMPGRKGLDWLQTQRDRGGFTDTIMITAYADLQTAIEAMRAGVSDFLLKPFRSNQILNAVGRCLELARLKRENFLLRRELETGASGTRRRELIGQSPAIAEVRQILERVAPLSTPVLILGASGSGKEVAARHIHCHSGRSGAPFVAIQCGAIPADMIEYELFGHAAGAFPGARSGREGLLASASGGTVFLDDVSELGANAQTALLRVLEDGVIRPIGTERDIQLQLRFVIASTKPLQKEVQEGRFREDLLFRINVVEVRMPALKERSSDILELAELFQSELSAALNLPRLDMTSSVRSAMLRHDWPGNIRELQNFIERALIFGRFPVETLGPPQTGTEITPLEDIERREILRALEALDGNRSEAARRLGVSRKTIDRKCAAWGL
ncbi:sigma-54-dependent Fis family transcriptional regulator [Rhodovulum sp. BSW8]|uniref:Sigma-54-dependent Fis family transcriptional regulator n=1 Tax=Rhodovulum visakhapatnamense TaxID=364297 RepID=A0ABS1RCF1_9RHOB|nr:MULTISPECIES: sigma-54 dependent transcriptional regulator [Rhodovulum]MBL3570381.1 sigma-54-dependent Fis family transcriptional regulator [Rhodovulum visakhapatnamense]MBL3576839.1 sigma-54-dependent Fis family transcriptional regulator [Rhodovulum visakhapatnamense]OLS43941.1 sigma-54-dependent Fis family transcriptional regulator [Rhodovulum sulfidophilum]RBO51457.1 sigma-54-dependent Fis family transcriptional regulator [Rhodovulum sp. BSW8]